MAGKCERKVLRMDPTAVIAHADQPDPALIDVDIDLRGASI